jgi:hypothetical protein
MPMSLHDVIPSENYLLEDVAILLSIYQFRSTAQSGGRGKHDRMSLVIRRSPRVNQEVLLRATFFG